MACFCASLSPPTELIDHGLSSPTAYIYVFRYYSNHSRSGDLIKSAHCHRIIIIRVESPILDTTTMIEQQVRASPWAIVTMLFFAALINNADKGVLGLAAVPIMHELALTPKEFGLLGSSLFFLYPFSAILVSLLTTCIHARWLLLGLVGFWSLVQFPMMGSVGFLTLAVCRILLGAGEGPAYPVTVHALYKWFPNAKRTLPTAVVCQGSTVGVIIALPILNLIIIHYSWHWAFGILGLIGLLWVAVWFYVGKEGPLEDAADPYKPIISVPYRNLLLTPTFVGCCLASFGAYWTFSLSSIWFTPFIVDGLGYQQATAGFLAPLPWVVGSFMLLSTGWASQALMTSGLPTRIARGVLGSLPLFFGGFMMLAIPFVGIPSWKIALLVLGSGLTASIYVVCPPLLSEFTPVSQRSTLIAFFNTSNILAGILAPFLNGAIIEGAPMHLQGYHIGFLVAALFQVLGGLSGLLLIRPPAVPA
jgi:MFS family permease